jgi:hypothetical protein
LIGVCKPKPFWLAHPALSDPAVNAELTPLALDGKYARYEAIPIVGCVERNEERLASLAMELKEYSAQLAENNPELWDDDKVSVVQDQDGEARL